MKLSSAKAPVLSALELTGPENRLKVQLIWSEVSDAAGYVLQRAVLPIRRFQSLEGAVVPIGSVPSLASDSRKWPSRASDFRELYRGPDRSYSELPAQLRPQVLANYKRRLREPVLWRYRVRAIAFSQAGLWSNTLDFLKLPVGYTRSQLVALAAYCLRSHE